MVFPHARAGAIFHVEMTSGKFHDVIRAHTPTGSRRVTSSPGSWIGTVSPKILFAAPPQYSRVSATIPISSRASRIGFPTFRASSLARSSSRSRTNVEARSSTRPRTVAEGLGHLRHRGAGPRLDHPEGPALGGGPALAAQDQQLGGHRPSSDMGVRAGCERWAMIPTLDPDVRE